MASILSTEPRVLPLTLRLSLHPTPHSILRLSLHLTLHLTAAPLAPLAHLGRSITRLCSEFGQVTHATVAPAVRELLLRMEERRRLVEMLQSARIALYVTRRQVCGHKRAAGMGSTSE